MCKTPWKLEYWSLPPTLTHPTKTVSHVSKITLFPLSLG